MMTTNATTLALSISLLNNYVTDCIGCRTLAPIVVLIFTAATLVVRKNMDEYS